ncbi:hypothetical protein CCL42_gp58 [Sulfolobus islandicus rod-shaped virus 8]|uniref:Uncharacterized protein n=1 Tax=Sulfolobus islandicus rod-shaped virus 8 TaxID=1983551 RepID=A0A1X9SJP3_9VIRU|nr:hypothetical protein CCL42_gp58 [Sulfolobus islandicus rod-shaped virus 8]ARQ96464.1 hypothetical protein [Sulfolobus islandicus rod-shaped virus 8]
MAEEKSQNSFKEKLEGQVNISFLIQLEQVKGRHIEYSKLYVVVNDTKNEISFTYLNPEDIDFVKTLQKIARLYKVYKEVNNQKIAEGTREEILKLIALLIWNIY